MYFIHSTCLYYLLSVISAYLTRSEGTRISIAVCKLTNVGRPTKRRR